LTHDCEAWALSVNLLNNIQAAEIRVRCITHENVAKWCR